MNVWYRFFTPPRFLAMPAAGVEISDSFIRAVSLEGTPSSLTVSWWAEEPLPEGAVAGGLMRDKNAVADALKKIYAAHRFDFAHFSIPEQQSFAFEMSVPAVSLEEARLAVGLRLEEYVPLRASDAVFDVSPFQFASVPNREYLYGVAVVSRKVIELYLAACETAGIAALSFDLAPAALARSAVGARERRPFLVANLSEDGVGLSVVSGGTVRFSSTLPVSAKPLVFSTGKKEGADAALIESTLRAIGTEAERIRDFWDEHHRETGQNLYGAVACGSGANSTRAISVLSAALRLPVEQALVWRNAFSIERTVPPIPHDDSLRFAGAIGLALRSFSYV